MYDILTLNYSFCLIFVAHQVSADMSFLCISSDAEKLTVFAYATDAAVALEEGRGGVRANEWVARTLKVTNRAGILA